MTKNVIVVAKSDTIETAVETLQKNWAPVVGERNKFVGILSINDLVATGAASSPPQQKPPAVVLSHGDDQTTWDLFERAGSFVRALAVERVEQRMSRQSPPPHRSSRLPERCAAGTGIVCRSSMMRGL